MWMLWSNDGSTLEGIMISHVDDLLMGGNSRAQGTLESLGAELGFGSISSQSFVYCGKKIEQLPDGTISVTMDEYHSNLQPVRIAPDRKKKPETPLCPSEHKQLRAVLGSLQWLVAQIRYDVAFQLSSLQGESAHPTIGTLLRANQLVRKVKENPNFALKFRPMNLKDAGIVVVSDASLGNMTKAGTAQGESLEKVYSQASYYVLLADRKLLDGQPGQFAILDARSHRLQRVCRSTFAAELMGIEEAMDAGQYCRGVVAEACGHPLDKKPFELSTDSISMVIVTDSKDAYDKSSSSTPSYGSQKSLAFTIAWIHTMLARSNTMIRWTSTENLFVDCGTKEMDNAQLLRIMDECRWCISYSPSFVKQSSKGKSAKKVVLTDVRSDLGEPFESTDPIFGHVMKLSKQAGWHRVSDDLAIHVCLNARSYRTPEPRFKQAELPFRTTFACFEGAHALQWRRLEDGVKMSELRNARLVLNDPTWHCPPRCERVFRIESSSAWAMYTARRSAILRGRRHSDEFPRVLPNLGEELDPRANEQILLYGTTVEMAELTQLNAQVPDTPDCPRHVLLRRFGGGAQFCDRGFLAHEQATEAEPPELVRTVGQSEFARPENYGKSFVVTEEHRKEFFRDGATLLKGVLRPELLKLKKSVKNTSCSNNRFSWPFRLYAEALTQFDHLTELAACYLARLGLWKHHRISLCIESNSPRTA
eukprot:g30120.t1